MEKLYLRNLYILTTPCNTELLIETVQVTWTPHLMLKLVLPKRCFMIYQWIPTRICTKWSPIQTYLRHKDLSRYQNLSNMNHGIKLHLMQCTLKNHNLIQKTNLIKSDQILEPTVPSCNKEKINKTSKEPWLNLRAKCHQLLMMKLLKNTTNSTLSKLLLTTTTDCLKLAWNTIINGKPNLSFFLTLREITLGTSMSTIT